MLGSTSGLSYGNPLIITSETQVPPSATPSNLLQNSFQVKRRLGGSDAAARRPAALRPHGQQLGLGHLPERRQLPRLRLRQHRRPHHADPEDRQPLLHPDDRLASARGRSTTCTPTTRRASPYAFDRLTGAYRYVLEIARKDSPEELRKTLDAGKTSINYGFWGQYRSQANDLIYGTNTGIQSVTPTAFASSSNYNYNPNGSYPLNGNQSYPINGVPGSIAVRNANFWVPDVWGRIETRKFRFEGEMTYVNGSYLQSVPGTLNGIPGLYSHQINLSQFGAAIELRVHFLPENALTLQLYAGVATGNGGSAHGFGNQPGRGTTNGVDANNKPVGPAPPGTIDATPIYCPSGTEPCPQNRVNAFNFNHDYRIDLVLWRQILGGITDAWYVRPARQVPHHPRPGCQLRPHLLAGHALEHHAGAARAAGPGVRLRACTTRRMTSSSPGSTTASWSPSRASARRPRASPSSGRAWPRRSA